MFAHRASSLLLLLREVRLERAPIGVNGLSHDQVMTNLYARREPATPKGSGLRCSR